MSEMMTLEEIKSAFARSTDPERSLMVRLHSAMTKTWEERVKWLIERVHELEAENQRLGELLGSEDELEKERKRK